MCVCVQVCNSQANCKSNSFIGDGILALLSIHVNTIEIQYENDRRVDNQECQFCFFPVKSGWF